METQVGYYLAFNALYKLNSSNVLRLLEGFGGDAAAAWQSPQQWDRWVRWTPKLKEDVLRQHQTIDPVRLYSDYLAAGCGLTWLGADDYPAALAEIFDPPLVLFYRGSLPSPEELALALIGSRRATPYGHQVAEIFARDLAYQGIWIISGMARGIDSICHRGALSAGGKTLAVLGSGIDVIYPRENEKLYYEICDHGAVVSEFPLGMAALAQNFPRRNRIISGLAQGVVVIEAALNSGTMHTVNHALEQGKDVFAVPGPITSQYSKGTNQLIRECPSMVMATCAEDIWRRYMDTPMKQWTSRSAERAAQPAADKKNAGEQQLLQILQTPYQFDQLAGMSELGLTTAQLASLLTILEIKGLIRQLPGKYYQTVVKNIK